MSAGPEDAARLEALERRAAHQDRAIDDLNAAVTAQWAVIEALQRRLAVLDRRLEDLDLSAESSRPPPG